MICPNCNSVFPEGSIFCENCGAKLKEQASQTAVQQVPNVPKKKTLDKRIVGVAAAVLAIIVIVIVCVSTYKHKIDLNDFVTVEFTGYETKGKADITFDYEAFYKEISDVSDDTSYLAACQEVDWDLSKKNELSNGDKVTLTFTCNNEAAKKCKIKFVGEETEYEVEGLKEIEVVDAFADIELTFSGVSPNVTASVENNSKNEAVKNQYFTIEGNGNLKKGDTFTVTINIDNEESLVERYGCVLKETSKEYTCENVDEYITDGSSLGEEVLAGMKEQTKDVIDSYFAGNGDEIKGSSIKYVGYYFLSRKNDSEYSWGDANIAYIVYSAKVKSKEKKFKETTVYMSIKFTNIIKYADGTDFVNLNSTDIQGSTDLSLGWWNTVKGYTKESDMKNELVTSQKSTYNVASFGDLK